MRIVPILIASAMTALGAAEAFAQTPAGVPPASGRFTVSINGGFQPSKQEISRPFSFTLYDEDGSIDSLQPDVEGGGLFDIGVSARLRDQLGAGISYTFLRSSSGATITGGFPHPLFFDQPRPFAGSVAGLAHKEHGVHLFATWNVPFTEQIEFTVSAGPSIFRIDHEFAVMGDLIDKVVVAEVPPFTFIDTNAISSISVASRQKTAVGFNIGLDATYAITRMFGAGVMMRFSRAEADMTVEQGDVSVEAGGFQIGGGLRVRF